MLNELIIGNIVSGLVAFLTYSYILIRLYQKQVPKDVSLAKYTMQFLFAIIIFNVVFETLLFLLVLADLINLSTFFLVSSFVGIVQKVGFLYCGRLFFKLSQ